MTKQIVPPRSAGTSDIRAELSAVPSGVTLPILQYIHAEQAAGIMLIAGAVIALGWANSPWAWSYELMWGVPIKIAFIEQDLHHWVNNGLMTLFFLLVGLEIKRELVYGELSSRRRATVPLLAAAGGILLPASLYLLLNWGGAGARGWGVPVATDIAFVLGLLALLGKGIPISLKVFLLAVATIDDIAGVMIIAVAYTARLSWTALGAAAGLTGLILLLRRLRVTNPGIFGMLGVGLWVAMVKSGVHATIAGVVLGLLTPARKLIDLDKFSDAVKSLLDDLREATQSADEERQEMLIGRLEEMARHTESSVVRFERLLRPWVSYLVLPVFALANAGITLTWQAVIDAGRDPIAHGIIAGLLIGKFAGVLSGTWLATKLRLGALPRGTTWTHMIGASILAAIGFTVSLFIAELAFENAQALAVAKVAILLVSVVAGTGGMLFLVLTRKGPGTPPADPSTDAGAVE